MPNVGRHACVRLQGNALLLAKLLWMRLLSRRALYRVSVAIFDYSTSHLPSTFYYILGDNVASKFSPPNGFLNTYQSPKKGKSRVPTDLPNHIAPLNFHTPGILLSIYRSCINLIWSIVPVYDARSVDAQFEWTAQVFENLGQHFKAWPGEVPSTSFVAIGYGVQFFKTNDKLPEEYRSVQGQPEDMWKVTPYIHWVLLFATPTGWMDPVRGWMEGNEGE